MADTEIEASRTLMELPKGGFNFSGNFEKDVDDIMRRYGLWIMRSLLRVFATEAARFTPPNMGKSTIEDKYYYRPILTLIKLVRGEYRRTYATPQDKEMLKQGYNFKVLNTRYKKHQKGEAYAYTKDIKEAKTLSRIKNRGLARYSWAGALNNKASEMYLDKKNVNSGHFMEIELPLIFKRLVRQSPDISKYNFISRAMTYRGGVVTVQIENKLAQSERYCAIAVARGTAAVDRWQSKFFDAVKNKCQDDIIKMLKKTKLFNVKFVVEDKKNEGNIERNMEWKR